MDIFIKGTGGTSSGFKFERKNGITVYVMKRNLANYFNLNKLL